VADERISNVGARRRKGPGRTYLPGPSFRYAVRPVFQCDWYAVRLPVLLLAYFFLSTNQGMTWSKVTVLPMPVATMKLMP